MNIYIARGEDTLGPYTPEDAVALMQIGLLAADDLAAREGDAAWVPLTALLSQAGVSVTTGQTGRTSVEAKRRLRASLTILPLAVLLLVGVAFWWRSQPPSASVVPPEQARSSTLSRLTAVIPPSSVAKPAATPLVATAKPSPTPPPKPADAAVVMSPTVVPSPTPGNVAVAVPPEMLLRHFLAKPDCHLGGNGHVEVS